MKNLRTTRHGRIVCALRVASHRRQFELSDVSNKQGWTSRVVRHKRHHCRETRRRKVEGACPAGVMSSVHSLYVRVHCIINTDIPIDRCMDYNNNNSTLNVFNEM